MELKAISETRWACQASMLHVVCKRIKCVYALLFKVSNSSSDSSDRKVDARGLLSQFKPAFIRFIFALRTIFQLSKATSDLLQNPHLDYSEALLLLDGLKDELLKMRKKSALKSMWDQAAILCQEMGIEEEKKKRRRVLPPFLKNFLVESPAEKEDVDNYEEYCR